MTEELVSDAPGHTGAHAPSDVPLAAASDGPSDVPAQDTADEALGDRLTRLARVTASLVRAQDMDTVSTIVVHESADAVGATIASLSLLEGEHVRLVGLRGGLAGAAEEFATYPLSLPVPTTDAIRSGERVMLSGRAEIQDRYPDMPGGDRGERSIICLPLKVPGGTMGAIGLSFPGHRVLDAAELDFFEILADTCAQAILRIRAQDEAAERQAKLSFLAEASAELGSSLDYEATLAQVARLAVPTFADWAAIDLVRDGRLHRLAVAHYDPTKVQLAQELAERYPADPDATAGPWHVMRTGQSELIAVITDEMLVAGARDAEHLQIARDLNLRSALTVPLIARERLLGVMSWVAAESGRTYGADDVAFAEELAKRAATAIDNSELHSETLAAATRLQHAVLPDHMPQVRDCDLAAYYSPSGRTDVGGDFYDVTPLEDGRLVLFVGDVMGRGVAAAAAMAQMRAAVRAYVALDPSPDVVVERLDQMLLRYGGEQLVTLAYLVVDLSSDTLSVANAGHPPPVLLHADGSVAQLPAADGSPLGVQSQHRRAHTVPFCPGDALLVFTDGLIERRLEDIDEGQQRLVDRVAVLRTGDLHSGLTRLVAQVRDATRDDDVAALALRRHQT